MARHRYDELDDRVRWGGPALLEEGDGQPNHHARQDEEPGADRADESERLTHYCN